MNREEKLKKFDIRTRNKIRYILSDKKGNAIGQLAKLSENLTKNQIKTLEEILNVSYSSKAVKKSIPFPKKPQFHETLQINRKLDLKDFLSSIEENIIKFKTRVLRIIDSLREIDLSYSKKNYDKCIIKINETISEDGWSHALLRRIVLIRENLGEDYVDERIEKLINEAGKKGIVVSTLIHTFAKDQNILMSKRSVLNIADRGIINRYTRTLAKLSVQPFAISVEDFESYLKEVLKCSLIDALILIKFNSIYVNFDDYPFLKETIKNLGNGELFEPLLKTYDLNYKESEYIFYKQSSAWLEYDPIINYRLLIDNYYDSSRESMLVLPKILEINLQNWIGEITLSKLVSNNQFTNHNYGYLAKLECSSFVSRSAIFNYWLAKSEGQLKLPKEELFTLMGLTRDLARTIPINSTRTAAKLSKDELVKLILLLLLAKRSKNELDNFLLRRLLADITINKHNGSLVELVTYYQLSHPYLSEYIYDIATEDFLAKLTKIAPHRSDIPEIRASLHEWMAKFTNDEYYLQRARAVRIDHQINRVRNEIDDHRIYVDPMRFTSWIEDEMMLEINSALSSTGSNKKGVSVTCDETVLSLVVTQSYNAFCSNPVFGIASYIGRRIRHGTFHGHMYSSIINQIEREKKFQIFFKNHAFINKWSEWKDIYNSKVEEIIAERLHVFSKTKPLGLLTPEVYNPLKQSVLNAAVSNISKNFTETVSTQDLCPIIIDYCWRLAEIDLISVIDFFRTLQSSLKNVKFIEEELLPVASSISLKLADIFRRDLELAIDRKISIMLGWFKRPSIVAPKASVSLLFAATVAEVKDTVTEFDPQNADFSEEEIDLVGNFYHLIYDSLAIVVSNAAKYGDLSKPLNRRFEIVPGKVKRLIIRMSSTISPTDDPVEVSEQIEIRKKASFIDANLYDRKSGISKLLLLANSRKDFTLDQYEVIGREVHVRLSYELEH